MAQDSYIQLAPDSTGKKIETSKFTRRVDGVDVDMHTQRADLVGASALYLQGIYENQIIQTALLRAILVQLGGPPIADDYLDL